MFEVIGFRSSVISGWLILWCDWLNLPLELRRSDSG